MLTETDKSNSLKFENPSEYTLQLIPFPKHERYPLVYQNQKWRDFSGRFNIFLYV
jgi:hypothetical protein